MHSYQSPMAEDTPDVPPLSDITDKSVAPNIADVPNSTASQPYTTSGKIRRMPSAIRLQPYEQDTAIVPVLPAVASATEAAEQPYQNTYFLDAPQTPAPSAEIVAAIPLLGREVMHTQILPLHSSLDKVLQPRNCAQPLYIPPMILRSREPDEGEVLLGCCVLLMLSIVMSCGLYYFLIHIH